MLGVEPTLNQRVGLPEQLRPAEGQTKKGLEPFTIDRVRFMPNPALPGQTTMKTVGNTGTVLPLQVGQTVPAGTLRASQFQKVDAVRRQALGTNGTGRFDESAGASYYNALQGARELDAARRGKNLDRIAGILENRSAEDIQNIRLVWKQKMGPETLDVALRSAFPEDADRVARLLRGRPVR